jgi:exportin-2 (importin alpha re-exporter)
VAGCIEAVLGVFQKLISSRATDHEGFYLIESIVEYMPPRALDPFIKRIFTLLFARLKSSRTPKYLRCMLVFLGVMIGKHGGDFVIQQIDAIQAGLTGTFIDKFWLPTLQSVHGKLERKICVIGLTRLLCNSPLFLERYFKLWDRMLNGLLKLMALPEDAVNPQLADGDYEAQENQGWSAEYVKLASAGPQQVDPFSNVTAENIPNLVASSLSKLTATHPGKFACIKTLPPACTDYLQQMTRTAGVSLSL